MDADLSNRIGEADERFVPGTSRGQLIEVEHLVRYWWATALAPGRRVLDAGCGVGYGSAMLATAGAASVTGVDVSAEAVAAAAATAPPNTSFIAGDLHTLPFDDGAFDLIVCFEVIEHLVEQDAVIAELARVLAHDGILVMSSPNRDVYPPGNPHHLHEYVPDELCSALAEHLPNVQLRRQHDWIASAILDDDQIADDSLEPRPDILFAKAQATPPASETYTIALASRTPLPEVESRAVLGGLHDVRAWLDALPRLEATAVERDRARADVRALQELESSLRSDNVTLLKQVADLQKALRGVHASLSWRITRPFRVGKSVLDRRVGRK